jgi:hypothetical protein
VKSLLNINSATIVATSMLAMTPAHSGTKNPLAPTAFNVEIDGVQVPGLTRVDFPKGAEVQVAAETNALTVVRLTRNPAGSNGNDWIKWRTHVMSGASDARSISLVYFASGGAEVGRHNLYSCTPIAWRGPELGPATSGLLTITESLDISCKDGATKGL